MLPVPVAITFTLFTVASKEALTCCDVKFAVNDALFRMPEVARAICRQGRADQRIGRGARRRHHRRSAIGAFDPVQAPQRQIDRVRRAVDEIGDVRHTVGPAPQRSITSGDTPDDITRAEPMS